MARPAARPGGTMRKLLSRDLSALLGATRAAVLEAVADGGSTTELALRLGISPSSASEHAAVLRGAGLITSTRTRNQVRHRLTPLGAALLGLESPPRPATDPTPRTLDPKAAITHNRHRSELAHATAHLGDRPR
ncbi:winged helix-turn-helix transcriptional regulator [Nocardia otitidiscaviarum]|nr:winged helix-turn-helix transcriptional regulator [Nocardia otitidiscaviarum]